MFKQNISQIRVIITLRIKFSVMVTVHEKIYTEE